MSLKLRALHQAALLAGVQMVYSCKFLSADLSRKSPGRTLWETMDVIEAIRRWKETTGAEHDKGSFQLILEATVGQAGAILRQEKPHHTHDFWEGQQRGVPEELSVEETDRPTDTAAAGGQGPE